MSAIVNEVLQANQAYSTGLDKGGLPMRPERRFAILKDKYINWLSIKDQAESVLDDVVRIKSHSLVPADIPVYHFIYDIKSGCLLEVPAATKAGRAS